MGDPLFDKDLICPLLRYRYKNKIHKHHTTKCRSESRMSLFVVEVHCISFNHPNTDIFNTSIVNYP